MNSLYEPVAKRASALCEYCLAPEEVFNFAHEVEHIVPRVHGGSDDLANLALACHACNLFKSAFETGFDVDTQMQIPLFHPRNQEWTHHFRYDAKTVQIIGISAIGRATVARLQMNRPQQIAARRRWVELNLFP